MVEYIEGFVFGIICITVGFIGAMYVMRWAVSDLRESARRAIRFQHQAEEIIKNVKYENRLLKAQNTDLKYKNANKG